MKIPLYASLILEDMEQIDDCGGLCSHDYKVMDGSGYATGDMQSEINLNIIKPTNENPEKYKKIFQKAYLLFKEIKGEIHNAMMLAPYDDC